MSLNIYQRLNKVRGKVDYLKKDKEVQGYKAITHDAVTSAIRPHFIEQGIIVEPCLVSSATIQETGMSTRSGVPIIRYEAIYDVRFINIDNPEDRAVVRQEAHALDQGDKAPGKATSYATKYAMLKVLSIETGEDEEGRQQTDSTEVAMLRRLVNEGDPMGLFDMRYSMNIEQWNAVTGHARQDATKKRDWDNMVTSLLQEAEETFARSINVIRDAVKADDAVAAMEAYDELTNPQKRYVFTSLDGNEKAFIRSNAVPKKAA